MQKENDGQLDIKVFNWSMHPLNASANCNCFKLHLPQKIINSYKYIYWFVDLVSIMKDSWLRLFYELYAFLVFNHQDVDV